MSLIWTVFVICIQITLICGQNFTAEEIQIIDNIVQAVRDCRNIPGLGISLVRNGSVLYRGYGQARLDPPVSFDEFTVSNIGSTTKAFTAALLGILITESKRKGKRLGWDSKVVDILGSNFQMSTDIVTSEMTIKDMLTHRTGLQNPDLSLITAPENITRAAFVRRLKYLPQTMGFRDKWSYNNFIYMMAGHLAEVLGGKPFETLIKEKILDPLGMSRSYFLDDLSSRDGNFAFPYFLINGTLNFTDDDLLIYSLRDGSPTGALCSSSKDLSKWLIFLLGNGTTENGLNLIAKDVFEEMFEPSISLPRLVMDVFNLEKPYPVNLLASWYGYAWFGQNYRGQRSVFHTGNFHAYKTVATLYPKAKSGFFMMVNGPLPMNPSTDLMPLSYVLSDILLQKEHWLNISTICSFPEPWVEKRTMKKTVTKISSEKYDFTPCLGKYGNAIYGEISISDGLANQNLSFKLNGAGKGGLTLLSSSTSKFHMNFADRISLIFGQSCEAQFATLSDGLFQKLHLKCFGEYDFYRGVSFRDFEPTSSSTFMTCDKSLIILSMFILLLLVHLNNP